MSPLPRPVVLDVSLTWRGDQLVTRRAGAAGLALQDLAPVPVDAASLEFVLARADRVLGPAGSVLTVHRAATEAFELYEGPVEVPLADGDRAELRFGAFAVVSQAGVAEAMPPARRGPRGVLGFAFALAAHVVALGLAAHEAHATAALDEPDRTEELRGLLASAELRATARAAHVEDNNASGQGAEINGHAGDGKAGGGARADGAAGKMGDALSHAARARYAVARTSARDPNPETSRVEAMRDAADFGMIGLLAQGPAAPASPFGADVPHGADAVSAGGGLFGPSIGDAFGSNALGLSGIGEGGGGMGQGIGLGSIGTIGHSYGAAGSGTGGEGGPPRMRGTHKTRVYRCGGYSCSVSGRLPAEAIQRIVRQNFGRFRLCYEQRSAPQGYLTGTVTARFIIGRDGSVSNVARGPSTLGDPKVETCVMRAFYGLTFPQPEGGIVTVSYPIAFYQET